jgi:hypothetical protein
VRRRVEASACTHPVLKSPHLSRARRLTGPSTPPPLSPRQPDGILCASCHRREGRRRALPSRPRLVRLRRRPSGDGEGSQRAAGLCSERRAGPGEPWPHMASGISVADCVVRRRGSWSLLECAIRRRQARAAQLISSGSVRVLRVSWKLVGKKGCGVGDIYRACV